MHTSQNHLSLVLPRGYGLHVSFFHSSSSIAQFHPRSDVQLSGAAAIFLKKCTHFFVARSSNMCTKNNESHNLHCAAPSVFACSLDSAMISFAVILGIIILMPNCKEIPNHICTAFGHRNSRCNTDSDGQFLHI